MKGPESAGRGTRRILVVALLAVAAVCFAIIGGVLLESIGAASDSTPTEVVSTSVTIPVTTTAVPTTAVPTTGSTASPPSSTTTTIYTHAIEDPKRIVIPAIKADALIIKVAPQADGNMQVPPFGLAGWFHVGPAPGAPGPAVIVGHVDSKKGPDVFYRLNKLKPGDEILVYDASGDVATFVVDSSELVLKTQLPTQRIWNNTPQPVIRLITCGGKFNRSTGHYLSNTIVYGHLVK